MKKFAILLLTLFLVINILPAQTNLGPASGANFNNFGPLVDNVGAVDFKLLTFFDKAKIFRNGEKSSAVEGSLYLFKTWKNLGTLLVGNKKYKLENINFNIEEDAFMSKVLGDSLLVFDSNYIESANVNGKQFQYVYSPADGKKKMFEVMYKTPKYSVLKGYYVSVKLGSPNPMLNRKTDKIRQSSKYFILKDGSLTNLKLQKKSILKLIKKENIAKVKEFVDKGHLSYRKVQDVIRIFRFKDAL